MPSSLGDEKTVTWYGCFTCSRFAFYLQKFLGRPSPVHVHLQAAVQKVTKHSGQSLGVLQLWCPVRSYQIQRLEKKETRDSTCFFHIRNCSYRPHFQGPVSSGSFFPDRGLEMIFLYQQKNPLMQPQLFQHQNDLALTADFIG